MERPDFTQSLVERAREGDHDAFEALVHSAETRLVSFIRTRLGQALRQHVEVEDILQETHLRAFRSIERFRWKSENSLFSWLATVAEYVIRDQARLHQRRGRVALVGDVPAPGVSPSRALRREERFDRLQDALKTLSADHRQAILLARIERLPLKEVARRMERSRGAVKQLLLRGLQQLRESFKDTESLGLPDRLFHGDGVRDGE